MIENGLRPPPRQSFQGDGCDQNRNLGCCSASNACPANWSGQIMFAHNRKRLFLLRSGFLQ